MKDKILVEEVVDGNSFKLAGNAHLNVPINQDKLRELGWVKEKDIDFSSSYLKERGFIRKDEARLGFDKVADIVGKEADKWIEQGGSCVPVTSIAEALCNSKEIVELK